MKTLFILLPLLLAASFAFADSNTNTASATANTDTTDTKRSEILLPDINLSIEDESEVPLQAQTNVVLSDEKKDFGGKTDLSELTVVRGSEKYLLDIGEEQKKDNFSLSTFSIRYGMFDHLATELTVGKRAGNVNYLLSYLRNRRGNAGIIGSNWNSYFNTEQQGDDLTADLIYFLSNNVELDAGLGYRAREQGLYTNRVNISEARRLIPVKLAATYNFDVFYSLKGELAYQYLDYSSKLGSGYNAHSLNDLAATGRFDASWGRNNFLRIKGDYLLSYYDTNMEHNGHLGALDRFFILPSVDLEVGGDLFISSAKSLFWYPQLSVYYKYLSVLNLRLGWTGSREALTIGRWYDEDQTLFSPGLPTETWRYLLTLSWTPVRYFTLRGGVFYDVNYHLAASVYDSAQDMYAFSDRTNVNILSGELKLDFLPFDNATNTLIVNATYRYRLVDPAGLLLLPAHTASAMFDYRHYLSGFEFMTSVSYADVQLVRPGVWQGAKLLWDAGISQSLNKDIYVELQLKNLLNQEWFEKPGIPSGGISAYAGIKFLL